MTSIVHDDIIFTAEVKVIMYSGYNITARGPLMSLIVDVGQLYSQLSTA